MRWGMVIDLVKCVGCYSCMISCKQERFLPPDVFWCRVLVTETGDNPGGSKAILPVLCNHCRDAICVRVCPSGATVKRADGIVMIDSDKCIGCRYCLVACPYQQRTYYGSDKLAYFPGGKLTAFEALGKRVGGLQKGTVTKCTFCADRVDRMAEGLRPGVDREATPVCVISCPVKARYFGNLDDPESEVSRLIYERKAVPLHPEHGTEPSVYYITD